MPCAHNVSLRAGHKLCCISISLPLCLCSPAGKRGGKKLRPLQTGILQSSRWQSTWLWKVLLYGRRQSVLCLHMDLSECRQCFTHTDTHRLFLFSVSQSQCLFIWVYLENCLKVLFESDDIFICKLYSFPPFFFFWNALLLHPQAIQMDMQGMIKTGLFWSQERVGKYIVPKILTLKHVFI